MSSSKPAMWDWFVINYLLSFCSFSLSWDLNFIHTKMLSLPILIHFIFFIFSQFNTWRLNRKRQYKNVLTQNRTNWTKMPNLLSSESPPGVSLLSHLSSTSSPLLSALTSDGHHPSPAQSDHSLNSVPDWPDIRNCTETELYNITTIAPIEFARPMYGIGMPILFLVTAVANSLIIAVLTRRHMKSPTNLVLLWMAVADLLTLASPAPSYFYMYTLGQHSHLLKSPTQCYIYSAMIEHIPMAFHTSSIWLTILLALQR